MKRILIALFLLIAFDHGLNAQNEDLQSSRFEFTIMPYSLIDINPHLRVGMEYYSSSRLGYSFDFGYGNHEMTKIADRPWGEDYMLFEFRAELKYFFILKEHIAFYVGTEFFSIQTEDVLYYDWYRKPFYPGVEAQNIVTHYDRADFYRQKYGVHFKAGLKLIAFKRVDFDFYLGVGAAHRTVEYSNVVDPYDATHYGDIFSLRRANAGEKFIFHLALGTKVGIILWED